MVSIKDKEIKITLINMGKYMIAVSCLLFLLVINLIQQTEGMFINCLETPLLDCCFTNKTGQSNGL
jgi:hypothetical protein